MHPEFRPPACQGEYSLSSVLKDQEKFRFTDLLPYLAGYALLPLYLGDFFLFSIPVFVFGVIPALDLLIKRDRRNFQAVSSEFLILLPVRIWPFFQVAAILITLFRAASQHWNLFEISAHSLSLGIITGAIGITYAHELIHKHNRLDTFLADILLTSVFYLHWRLHHIRCHHVRVGTPEDPASAPLGSTVYTFVPRSILRTWFDVSTLEAERLKKKGLSPQSAGNFLYPSLFLPLFAALLILFFLGSGPMMVFFGQAFTAVVLLELVNYIEHYGLKRKKGGDGTYEKPHPGISWNSDHRVTNAFLINLQRHSDHHARPRVSYPFLETREDAPQLPYGYALMILIALIPPLYRKIIDPLVPRSMKE
jgi:alkane 1-monooxygenase